MRALRMAPAAPVIPDEEYRRVAGGETVTGLVRVQGYKAAKGYGARVVDQPIGRMWAAINDDRVHQGRLWFLVDLDGASTVVEYYVWSDPGGSIPAGSANLFARGSITDTLEAMARLARDGVATCPETDRGQAGSETRASSGSGSASTVIRASRSAANRFSGRASAGR